jgi:hypothetical protein
VLGSDARTMPNIKTTVIKTSVTSPELRSTNQSGFGVELTRDRPSGLGS